MGSESRYWGKYDYLEVLGMDLISNDCIKALSEVVLETYRRGSPLGYNEPKYENYLTELKMMLQNMNEQLSQHGGGIEFNDLSGVVREGGGWTGRPVTEREESDIFYYKISRLQRMHNQISYDFMDTNIKEILVLAFYGYIVTPGKVIGIRFDAENIYNLEDAFRVLVDRAALYARLWGTEGWTLTTDSEYAGKGFSKRKKSKRKKSKSKKSKSEKSKK